MSETRVRAATLLSKVFLHFLTLLDGIGDKALFEDLWITIVGIMDRLGNSGQGDMEEAVNENLKNMLLVLSSGGYLAPPDEKPERERLWVETWKRINRFQPGLFKELFPEEASKPVKAREMDVAMRGGREPAGEEMGGEGGEEKEEDGEKEG